jgi:hypothetical protein
MEGGERINPSADWTKEFQCGCKVVFLGSCFHRSSRMTCCTDHAAEDKRAERDRLKLHAKRSLDIAMLNQPPL